MGEAVDVTAGSRIGHRDRKHEGAESRQGGFAVLAGKVGRMDGRVREKGADRKEGGGGPAIDEVARERGECHGDGGGHGEEAGFGGNREVRARYGEQMPLNHQQEADAARFYGLVSAKRDAELVTLMEPAPEIHRCRIIAR